MDFNFICYGHENVLALHRNTIEFTTATELTLRGDCIVGVGTEIDFERLIKFVQQNANKKIIAEITDGIESDHFSFILSPSFTDKHELVIRKGEFSSSRTIGVNADKAAKDIDRRLIERIKNKNAKIFVTFRT